MTAPSEGVELDIQGVHLRVGNRVLSERSLVPGDNPCLDQSIPVFFWPWWCLEDREWRGKVILLTEDSDMVGPGGGVIIAHLENIHDHAVDSGGWVAPDVEEKPKCTDVEQSFHRKLSEEEMQGWDGGSPT